MSEWDNQREEEESSFVSMADMMVGLLLIFIILLTYYVLTSQQAIQEAERVSKTEQAAVVTRGIILDRIRERIDDDRVEFDEATGTIRFSEEVLTFEPGDYSIPAEAAPVLDNLANALAETLPCLAYIDNPSELDCSWLLAAFRDQDLFERDLGDLRQFRTDGQPPLLWIDGVFVEGHTDCTLFRRAASPDFENWVLGARRAGQTYLFLTTANDRLGQIFSKNPHDRSTGFDAHRILGVASYADRRPAQDFNDFDYPPDPRLSSTPREACQALAQIERAALAGDPMPQNRRNRRIDIRIVMGWTAQSLGEL
jgi:chemotaxis protein MotB